MSNQRRFWGFLMIFMIFGFVKLSFRGDVGDYLISTYISFMVFSTSWAVVRNSAFFAQPHSFLQFPGLKYEKSSLSDSEKSAIHQKILQDSRFVAGDYSTDLVGQVLALAAGGS